MILIAEYSLSCGLGRPCDAQPSAHPTTVNIIHVPRHKGRVIAQREHDQVWRCTGLSLSFCAVRASICFTSPRSSLLGGGVSTDAEVRELVSTCIRMTESCRPSWRYRASVISFSFAALRVKPVTAALLGQYFQFPKAPSWPNTLATDTCKRISPF